MHWPCTCIMLSVATTDGLLLVLKDDQDQIDGVDDIMCSKRANYPEMSLLPTSLGFCLCTLHVLF